MAVYYLGAFPAPYGGVTIKNQNLYHALCREMQIKKIDFGLIKKKRVFEMIRFLWAFLNPGNRFIIGVSGKRTRRRFSKLLYWFNRKAMRRSIIMMMGGAVAKDIAQDCEYQRYVKAYKQIYVETDGMKETLNHVGVNNVSVYPNGRARPIKKVQCHTNNGALRCVFFSLIQPEKGADIILAAAKELPMVQFDFYGNVSADYINSFDLCVAELSNVTYHGVFSGTSDAVYSELSGYDVLLFPTKWTIEGVPGILVESKIAGLVPIVSDESYNAEIVKDGTEGLVLRENNEENLIDAIRCLEADREMLFRLKENSSLSAEKYYIDNYVMDIVNMISL